MTTHLYKEEGGEYIKHDFEAVDVAHALNNGFVATIPMDEPEPTLDELFLEKFGDADNAAIRELAEAAEIENFANAKIATLKQAILNADSNEG